MDFDQDQFMSKMTLEIFSKLEHKWLYSYPTPTDTPKKTRILSIDGGNGFSAVAATSLVHLESQIQSKTSDPTARIPDFFDIVVGTGTGALFAALLVADDSNNRPLFSARDAVSFLSSHHSRLFTPKSSFPLLRSKNKFSASSFEKTIRSALTRNDDGKILTLRDTVKPILIPCYDLATSAPFVFSRAGAAESEGFDFELWKVCRATTATPGRFESFEVMSVDGTTRCVGIDGGLVMNNPTAAAVMHVVHNKRDFPAVNGVEDLVVLSIGNGPASVGDGLGRRSGLGRGICGLGKWWRKRGKSGGVGGGVVTRGDVMGIVMDGVSETVDQMMGNAFCWNRTDYVRIQANAIGETKTTTMEDILNQRAVESLPFGGKRMLSETNGQRIESFVQRIVATGRRSLPPSPCKAVSPLLDGR
ncbi:hypothetical protein Droror1_Dr00018177 [Drosera rotundifolia]